MWIKIKDLFRLITKKLDDYDKKHTKIKLDSKDKLPLNKTIEIPVMMIVLRTVFMKIKLWFKIIRLWFEGSTKCFQ